MSIEADPVDRPVTLTVAGSDSGGGAGIQADLKTMEAVGTFGTSAITNVTAQNTVGVDDIHPVSHEAIRAQIAAVRDDFDVEAVKIGMLGTAGVVETVRSTVADIDPLVVDPVMVAESGDRLLDDDAEDAYEGLIERATLVTPNSEEARVLTGIDIEDDESAERAGEALVEMGADAALVTGGHRDDATVRDVLVADPDTDMDVSNGNPVDESDGETTGESTSETIVHSRVDTDATHGSGCALSSAIAARLAQGVTLHRAVRDGIGLLARAIRYHHRAGAGPGAVHHLAGLRNRAERSTTVESAAGLYGRVADRAESALVATPFADDPGDVVAVGRGGPLTDPAAPVLLGVRDRAPDCRVAIRIADASGDWPTIESDDRRAGARALLEECDSVPGVVAQGGDAIVVGATADDVIDRLDAI
ncbi:MAG: bifunctional hydroxymethylpyrimidine kinase/phosphomethylpyrimidine kinase [Halococcoides sp.]